jgi:hypothetical protein
MDLQIQQLPMSPRARSSVTHHLHDEMNSTIPTSPKFPPKKKISENLGFKIDNPIWTVFFAVSEWKSGF